MRARWLATVLLPMLAACCPVPQASAVESFPTAFIAEVVGPSEGATGLRLELEDQERVTASVTGATVITNTRGERLELADLAQSGARVYLVGRLQGRSIVADEIHVLAG